MSLERQQLQNIAGNRESTMNKAPSNSAGMLILILRGIYAHLFSGNDDNAKLENLNSAFQACITELRNLAATDHERSLIDLIATRANEAPSSLDNVTLYLRSSVDNKENKYSDVTYEFRLKEVLTLVWAATKDHAKYAAPKRNQTKETELHDRVKTLFDAFEKINSGICHHGVRNELVFSLNRVYQIDDKPVELLDDSLLVIMGIVRNVIANKLFSKYNIANADEKKAIEKSMINWMKEVNPQEILKTLDVDIESLKSDISKLFLAHGLNPAEKIFKDPIEFTLNQLEFAYDKQYPKVLELVNNIFSAVVNESTPCYRALEKVKIWIEAEYSFGNDLHKQRVINIDYVYQAYMNVLKYKSYLSVTNEERLNKFIGNCNDYFEHLALGGFPLVSPGLRIQIAELTIVIEEYKNDKLGGLIENFFCHWFSSNDENKTRKKLYKALLDKKIQDKILMTDAELANIAKHDNRYLDPYLINRIFLHAIIKKPAEWTDYFAYMFAQVLIFVNNQFNQPANSQVGADLRRDSYPSELLEQLENLLRLRNNQPPTLYNAYFWPIRIVLPENAADIADALSIFSCVDNADHLNLYLRNKIQFNRIIKAFSEKNDYLNPNYELPFEVLNIFIRENVATLVKNLNDFIKMINWLEDTALPINNFRVQQISETMRIMFSHCFNSHVFGAEIFDNKVIRSIIFELIRLGDIETMQILVNQRLNLNCLYDWDIYRLENARVFDLVDNQQITMIEFLVKNGFDLNNTKLQETLLEHAISAGKTNVIIPLLSLGACVTSITRYRGAIFGNNWSIIKKQLQDIVPDIRNVKTAAEAYISLRFLIDDRDCLQIYRQNKKVYHHAILQNPKILKYFPDEVLQEFITEHSGDIIKNLADYNYFMSHIIGHGLKQIILAKCVKASMDVNAIIDENNNTFLNTFLSNPFNFLDDNLVKLLISHGANFYASNSQGKRPIDNLSSHQRDVVNESHIKSFDKEPNYYKFLEIFCNLDEKKAHSAYSAREEFYDQYIPKHKAAVLLLPTRIQLDFFTNHCSEITTSIDEVLEILIGLKEKSIQQHDGYYSKLNTANIIRKCVQAGMDANSVIKFESKSAPLICFAMASRDLALIEVLLQHNVNVNTKNSDGKSALDIALEIYEANIFILLNKYNVKVTNNKPTINESVTSATGMFAKSNTDRLSNGKTNNLPTRSFM